MRLACPACAAAIEGGEAWQCKSCGWRAELENGVVVLVTQADRQDPILGSYFSNYDQIAKDDLDQPILDLKYVEHQAANMLRHVGDVKGRDVLDVGCGRGVLTRAFGSAGARSVVAVDISMDYLSRLSSVQGVTPVLANAESLPFIDSFDVLASTDVMEHVLNLGSFLVCANRALKTGGRAVIRVPLEENLTRYSAQAGCKYRFVHLRSFDRRLLHRTLRDCGFEVESSHVDGFSVYTPQPFWMAGPRRKRLYIGLQGWLVGRMSHASNVTAWPARFASLFMKPQEAVVVARKVGAWSS